MVLAQLGPDAAMQGWGPMKPCGLVWLIIMKPCGGWKFGHGVVVAVSIANSPAAKFMGP